MIVVDLDEPDVPLAGGEPGRGTDGHDVIVDPVDDQRRHADVGEVLVDREDVGHEVERHVRGLAGGAVRALAGDKTFLEAEPTALHQKITNAGYVGSVRFDGVPGAV